MNALADPAYLKLAHHIPPAEWALMHEDVTAIRALKRARNAIILAHNYQTPEIYHAVADIVGDSLALAREATTTSAAVIVVAGVHFMAETAKLLNPGKTVLTPDSRAGCSLADSITPADIRALRAAHPGIPIIAYVNTSAAVKAEVDYCCTSANARRIVEHAAHAAGTTTVIMLPDRFLAANTARETEITIIPWTGACEVHERFTEADIAQVRAQYPGVTILAHPECPEPVVAASDFSGSTAALAAYVTEHRPARAALITECSMADNIAAANPATEFVKPCNLCPHMKRITLANIRHALETMTETIDLDPGILARARIPVERMLAIP
ncbi:quinolinate synthase NadA [Acidiphilium acidophilum]|uniref:Quinolinate synthase n=1 Tax=Acidiphilium acidophilum TaxID=76588 RepID=A0AAW9DP08_ACIAO|nr:quinolinate synthase NadA [Acidiphilium acidophilum]MDX5930804.1 quinolinate synthase NadA [Acidiphilium acidophilum]MEE3501532.1 quinolinate synthase NadA [Acidiphilium acidophilum]